MTREEINVLYKKAVDNYYNKKNNIESALLDAVQIGLQKGINNEVLEEEGEIIRID